MKLCYTRDWANISSTCCPRGLGKNHCIHDNILRTLNRNWILFCAVSPFSLCNIVRVTHGWIFETSSTIHTFGVVWRIYFMFVCPGLVLIAGAGIFTVPGEASSDNVIPDRCPAPPRINCKIYALHIVFYIYTTIKIVAIIFIQCKLL